MKRLYFTFLFAIVASNLFGQSSGYLGKHFLLRSDFRIMPSIFIKKDGVNYHDLNAVKINTFSGLDYIYNDRNTMGISFSRYMSIFDFFNGLEMTLMNNSHLWTWSYFSEKVTGDLNVNYISINMKHFFYFNHLSPAGPYFKSELMLFHSKVTFDSNAVVRLRSYYDNYLPWLPGNWKKKYVNDVGIGFSLGYQRVYFQRLLFNLEFQTSLATSCIINAISNNGWKNNLKYEVGYSTMMFHLVGIQSGLGFLLF